MKMKRPGRVLHPVNGPENPPDSAGVWAQKPLATHMPFALLTMYEGR
jgi:hypothetical protein